MIRRSRNWPLLSALSLSCLIITCGGDEGVHAQFGPPADVAPTSSGSVGDGEIDAQIEAIRGRYRLPALIGVSFGPATIHEIGVAGVRVLGRREVVTIHDAWHIGSLTKSMTSMLAAMLIERGLITWTTTIADSFPDLETAALDVYGSIRLDELLTHTGGVTSNRLAAPSWLSLRTSSDDIHTQRRRLVSEYLALAPESERGTFRYSSAGYVVAGAMLEQAAGATWEQMMQQMLFIPLAMTTAGFGAPGTVGRHDQPWSHVRVEEGFLPLPPGPNADDPLAMGPAGTVHAAIEDLVRYYQLHLDPARLGTSLLTAESWAHLHTPAPGTQSGCGWGVPHPGELTHAGSNNAWYANVHLDQDRKLGLLVCTNAGGTEAEEATYSALQLLRDRAERLP